MTQDSSRRWQMLAITAAILYVLWLLAPVLMPFAFAAMLAYLGDPLADRLERIGMGRTLAVTVVFIVLVLVAVGALLLLIPLISRQIENLMASLPHYADWVRETAMPWLQEKLHLDSKAFDTDRIMTDLKDHLGSIGSAVSAVLGKITRSGIGVVMWLTNLVLIPVVAFYLLRDWDRLVTWIDDMLPRSIEPTIAHLARESDQVLGAFVRGQLLVMLALGIFYGAGLTFIGLSVGPLIGMVAGLLSFVPYLGFIVGFGSAIIAALVQFGDWQHVALVVGLFTIGQLLEGYVLVPRLVGEKIGLHPVAVIFAVLAGGYLFGFLGILLALPAASVILVVLRYLTQRYRHSRLYTEEGREDPVIADVEVAVSTAEGTVETSVIVGEAHGKDDKSST
ncbi:MULTISPECIES: AI-2E family transporter [Dyella]|uniref:AI-2E family transporter n=2 Tax=Dyella TaxID=231454 RepID=A0A4R0YK36_9GAMM|nr:MULTISPECIES: AI-2E family transporter [Dyella]TBR37142.1 AI-2E family transporter [Dyella terrae]TCI07768.1 AI-2E family transporter [Dyella soli]